MNAVKNLKGAGFRVIVAVALLMVTHLAQSASLPVGITADVVVKNSVSNPVPVQRVVGTPVLLTTDMGQSFGAMKQIFPDGTIATDEFVVPIGQDLVITDVNIVGRGLKADAILSLGIFNLASLVNVKPTKQWGPSTAFMFGDQQEEMKSITQSFSTGIVVSDQGKVRATFIEAGVHDNGYEYFNIWVTGYLRPAIQ